MHTESIKVISDQSIMINGEMINVHDIDSVVWDGFGNIVEIYSSKTVKFVKEISGEWKVSENPPSAEKYKQAELDRLRKRIIKLSEGDRMADSWGCLGKSIDEWEKIHNDKFMILGLEVKDKFVGGVLGVGK